ncbi:MAG: glycosyltransferase family 2 protein [Bacteroidaceae bacterium]|nr:glycosyltransferase family 2 protein [Bacteroidaceae bacterium]
MLTLFFEKIKGALMKRNQGMVKQKSYATWLSHGGGYTKEPTVSVVIQSHNKSVQIAHILPKLREYGHELLEIIVIDDGSSAEHTQRLAAALIGANEFLVRANDLYENITYDKCLRFANGRYVALIQDDDDIDGTEWMERAVELFEKYPKMVILGGKGGLDIAFEDDRQWAHGGKDQTHAEGKEKDFCFVTAVNRAPMWIRRDLYKQHLKHIDFRFAPFQFDDYEICARAWLCGLQVGWYPARFKSLSTGGMRIWNNQFTKEQSEKNGKLLYSLYSERRNELHAAVEKANQEAHLV